MYCKKCGKQLDEGANFCRNCGAPVTINQNTAPGIGGSVEKSHGVPSFQAEEAWKNEEKKGGKKIGGILVLCIFLLLAIGVGGIFMFRLNQDKREANTAARGAEPDLKEEEKENPEEVKDTPEKAEEEESEIQQGEAVAESENEPETKEIQKDEASAPESGYFEEDNGAINTYELIVADVTWTEAYQDCLRRGGHLVRINSEEEYQTILRQIEEEGKGNIKFWLGGTRNGEDSEEYRWINGEGAYGNMVLNKEEPFVSYWLTGEPSFYDNSISQDEMYMNMFYISKEERWVWNDVPDDLIAVAEFYSGSVGYICEYEN